MPSIFGVWRCVASIAAAGVATRLDRRDENADWSACAFWSSEEQMSTRAQADGTTALHWAAYRDDVDSADLLIRAGAKVNAANDLGVTPLWAACENGSAAMVRRLLQAGANPDAALLVRRDDR